MANLYEGESQSMMGEQQNLDLDINKITETVNGAASIIQNQNLIASGPPSTEVVENYPIKADTREKRGQRNNELYAWRKLPEGSERLEASNNWAKKWHGKLTYDEYVTERDKGKATNALEYAKGYSPLLNTEKMMSPAVGLVDWFTDLGNLATKSVRQPFKICLLYTSPSPRDS